MARKLSNGKWNPVVYSSGYVGMVELIKGNWKLIECDTEEEARRMEVSYREFWYDREEY